MAKILIIDSNQALGKRAARVLSSEGHECRVHRYLTEALLRPEIASAEVVFVESEQIAPDLGNSLSWILEQEAHPTVAVLAGDTGDDFHQMAIEAGAWDVFPRPANPAKLVQILSQALELRAFSIETGKDFVEEVTKICPELVTTSNRFLECLKLAGQAAKSYVNVLITGETGSGKELFAKAIHEMSSRSSGNLVLVDCASLPDNLIESTLFGHMRGSFTGADRTQEGLISQADKGTLFLDEVGELPPMIQKSFLRVLDEQSYRPIGGKTMKKSDFRVIAATNRDLHDMVKKSLFREDLLHRLMVISIKIPPLRDRREDIPLLTQYHIKAICRRYGIPEIQISPEFMDLLSLYHWPGNVRELIHSLERSVVAATGSSILYPAHLPIHVRSWRGGSPRTTDSMTRTHLQTEKPESVPDQAETGEKPEAPSFFPSLKEERDRVINRMEKDYLERLMEHTGGKISQAVRISGLSRSRLYGLMKQHGVRRAK